jgi:DNA-binding GntR family transcriptional regulator
MVQVEISQLTAECNAWREALRRYREEFSRDKEKLQETASQPLSKDQLQDVEHLHNQFHIQLINIHDLKHTIKVHCRTIETEMSTHNGQLRKETLADHESIFYQYQALDLTLQELRGKFERFLSHA